MNCYLLFIATWVTYWGSRT